MKSKNWSSIIDKLADGKAIDWQDKEDLSDDEMVILDQLQSIEKIAKVFDNKYETQKQSNIKSDNKSDSKIYNKELNEIQEDILFYWGHLQVVEKIGEGSFGDVYRAYDPILDRDVALKLFKQGDLQSLQSKNLIQEAKRLAKIRNEYVLAIHGANIYDQQPGIWSDLIIGSNLSTQSKQHKYNFKTLINIALEISSALISVHKAGIVHGDIKPSNIMFQEENKKYILMDFGAGVESSNKHQESDTLSDTISGTPLFMAPELFNDKGISNASDIYAFGVLLFKLATNIYPIKADNIADIYTAHKNKEYVSLNSLGTGLPKSFRTLIQSMISANPKLRPSAKQIKQKIKWIISTPVRRKQRLMVLSIITALLVGITLSSVGFYRANESKKTAVLEKEKAQSVNRFLQDMLSSAAKLGKGREVKIVDMLDIAVRDVDNKFKDRPHIKAATLDAIGLSYKHLLIPQKSIDLFTQSIILKKQWLADDSIEMFRTQLKLADSFRLQNDIDKSSEIINNVLRMALKNADVNKNIIDFSHVRLADNYNINGEFKKAESLFLSVIENMGDFKDSGNNIAYQAYLGLSYNYLFQTKFSLAKDTLAKALIEHNRLPNSSVSNLIAIKDVQAGILIKLGNFDQAETIYKEMLKLTKKHFGIENVTYLSNLSNYALLLQERGKYNSALKFQTLALELSSRIFDKNDKPRIKININMANIKVSLGLLSEGETIMRTTLLLARESLGETHIDTLTVEYNLAELLNKNGKFNESLDLAIINNAKMSKTLGENHLYTLLSLDNIAVSQSGLKQYQKAESNFRQVLTSIETTIGSKNPYMILVQQHLVDLFIASKQNQSAREQLQVLIDLQEKLLGSEHKDTVNSKQKLQGLLK